MEPNTNPTTEPVKTVFYGLACKNFFAPEDAEYKALIDYQQLIIFGRVINDDPLPLSPN